MSSSNLPTISGKASTLIRILLINPNATTSMTDACLSSLEHTVPSGVTVAGYTAPHPSPSAIEGALDSVLSAAACIRAIAPIASGYDAFLVACFSKHPLIDALREEVRGPVIGIMEASLYAARMLGGRLGIVTTGSRSGVMLQDAIRSYGLEGHSVGVEATGLGVLELESKPKEEVLGLMGEAANELKRKGADCIALGCAGMTEMKKRCEDVVGDDVMILDGVGLGVQFLVSLVREGHIVAKRGLYASAQSGRKARGQDWL